MSNEEEERVARHLAEINGDSWEDMNEEQREVYTTVAMSLILHRGNEAERRPEETVMQLGAFTFTRQRYGRVAIDVVDIESQVLPRELTAQEAVQLARFLVRDEDLLRDVEAQTDKK